MNFIYPWIKPGGYPHLFDLASYQKNCSWKRIRGLRKRTLYWMLEFGLISSPSLVPMYRTLFLYYQKYELVPMLQSFASILYKTNHTVIYASKLRCSESTAHYQSYLLCARMVKLVDSPRMTHVAYSTFWNKVCAQGSSGSMWRHAGQIT